MTLLLVQNNVDARPSELDPFTLKRAQRHDAAAFRELVTLYQHRVFALLSRLLHPRGRRDALEDLAQETFVAVYRALPSFRVEGPAQLSTWILTIATRLALKELRPRAQTVSLDDEHLQIATEQRTDDLSRRHRLGARIEQSLAALPDEYRVVFVLREYHDLEYSEIAEALGIELGTVRSRLSRARSALQKDLREVMP